MLSFSLRLFGKKLATVTIMTTSPQFAWGGRKAGVSVKALVVG